LRAAIIQTRAFIVSKERNTLVLVSIIISCCTTGFAATTMWYDYDTSPAKRKARPKIAGATPDNSRAPFFFVLVMSGALQVAAKSFSSALLLVASPKSFIAYTTGDHLLYQLYLAARGDHRHYRPGVSAPMSVVINVVQKVIADFTSSWKMRTQLDMHNAYFLFNQLTTHASVFVAVHVYVSGGGNDFDEGVLWMSSGTLFVAWAITYVARTHMCLKESVSSNPLSRRYIILACMVKPEYRHQFYTTETGVQYAREEYVNAKTHEEKMRIFTYNAVMWRHYKDEVREFTHANWAHWNEDKPAWFTETVIQRVPDEYIPVAALVSLNAAAHGGQRRRSNLGLVGSLRESVRESVRRDSASA
jgi:hypothetical protein